MSLVQKIPRVLNGYYSNYWTDPRSMSGSNHWTVVYDDSKRDPGLIVYNLKSAYRGLIVWTFNAFAHDLHDCLIL